MSAIRRSTSSVIDARRGILWMLLTMLLFVSMDTVAKYLTRSYAVPQVVWARYAFHALFLVLFLGKRIPRLMDTQRLGLQLVRSLFLLFTTILFFNGLSILPLAESTALMYIAPLIVTALSMPLLGEHVGPRRWAGVLVGFVGMLIIVRPGTGAMQLAALFPLGAATLYAFYQLTTRLLSRVDSPMTTLVYTALVGVAGTSLVVPFFWTAPDALGWGLMALIGLLGGISHFALIKALHAAPAATVTPFSYSSLIWSTALGLIFFGDFPDRWTLLGAFVIVGSGLYVFHREHRSQKVQA